MNSRFDPRWYRRLWFWLCAALCVVIARGAIHAQETREVESEMVTEAQRWLQGYYAKQAADYEFFRDDAKSQPMKMVAKPVFRWKQDDDWSGDVFLWTYQGRPEIVGCILASANESGTRGVAHEFHSLATKPLPRTQIAGGGSWQPMAGLKMTAFTDAEEPAKTATLRLSQMRTLARSFTAVMKHEGKDWELRFLPQPIHRYESSDAKVIDGGLFAYVWTRGTDPEMLLMLECREEQPQPRWYYAPVTFTSRSLRLTLKEKEVWKFTGEGNWITSHSTLPYQTFYAGRVTVPADNP